MSVNEGLIVKASGWVAHGATLAARSRRTALVCVAAWVLLAALLPGIAPSLKSVENNRTVNDPPPASQSVAARALLARAFPDQGGTPAVVVLRDPHGLGEAGRREVTRITATLSGPSRPPGVGHVVSPLGKPGDAGGLLSADGTTAQVIVAVLGASSEDAFGRTVDAIRRVAGTGAHGLEVRVTGPAGIARDTVGAFGNANLALLGGTVALVLVLLLVIYRSPLLALVPLLAAGLAIQVTNALGAALVKAGAFSVSSQAASIMTVLLFGVGTDYCLFIVSRYREQLLTTEDRYAAMREATRRLVAPLVSSAATVVLALLALLLATLPALHGFGPFLALGVVVMLACALSFVPAAVCLLGGAAFWPQRQAGRSTSPIWRGVAARVVARPIATVAAGTAILAVLSLGLLGYRESYDFVSGFRVATDSARGEQMLRRAFPPGAIAPTTMLLDTGHPSGATAAPAALRRLRDTVAATAGVTEATGPVISADGQVARLTVVYRDNPYQTAALDRTERLRRLAPQALKATPLRHARVLVGGDSAISVDIRTANDHDLSVIVPVTCLIVALVLALLLRSLIAPLYLLATTLASFAATLGLTVLCLVTIGGDDGIGERVTIYIFVFLVALVDYNILLTSRIREETTRHGPIEGVRRALQHTGGVITSAGLILAGTFAVLMTQPISALFQFGFAMATGLLLDTFLIRGTLAPAIARLLGPRNWWPGTLHAAPPTRAAPLPPSDPTSALGAE